MHWMGECMMDATCGCKWLSTDDHVTTGTKVAEAVAAALGPGAGLATAVVLGAGPAVAGLGPTTAATTGLAVATAETTAETTTGPSGRGPGLEEAEGEGLGPEASLTTVLNLAAGLGMTSCVHEEASHLDKNHKVLCQHIWDTASQKRVDRVFIFGNIAPVTWSISKLESLEEIWRGSTLLTQL